MSGVNHSEMFVPLTGEVLQQLTAFSFWLRRYGFHAGLPETLTALEAFRETDILDQAEWMHTLRSIYARSPSEWTLFDDLFHRFYFGDRPRLKERRHVDLDSTQSGSDESVRVEERQKLAAMKEMPGYSPDAGDQYDLMVKANTLKEITRLSKCFVVQVEAPVSRRFEAGQRERMDVRRTIRGAMRRAGKPVRLHWKRFAPDRPRLVILLDISGSMKEYANFYTTLAWSLLRTRARVQVFLFSTELFRITGQLRQRGLSGIREQVLRAGGLRGGTRIGQALMQISKRYPGVLSRHTVCMIASDGYDAGHPEQLHRAMENLRHRVDRIIWMNPLLANPDFQPVSTGMRIARPYIDAFVSVYDVVTWKQAVESGALFGFRER